MKTKEFVEKVNALGYDVVFNTVDIEVENSIGGILLSVQKSVQYGVDTDWSSFELLNDAIQAELFEIAVEYASTKPEEREEEKKYIYKFPFNVIYENRKDLHVIRILDGGLNLGNASVHGPTVNSRYHFTDKEVEKFTGKERALFNACEKIEVTE